MLCHISFGIAVHFAEAGMMTLLSCAFREDPASGRPGPSVSATSETPNGTVLAVARFCSSPPCPKSYTQNRTGTVWQTEPHYEISLHGQTRSPHEWRGRGLHRLCRRGVFCSEEGCGGAPGWEWLKGWARRSRLIGFSVLCLGWYVCVCVFAAEAFDAAHRAV